LVRAALLPKIMTRPQTTMATIPSQANHGMSVIVNTSNVSYVTCQYKGQDNVYVIKNLYRGSISQYRRDTPLPGREAPGHHFRAWCQNSHHRVVRHQASGNISLRKKSLISIALMLHTRAKQRYLIQNAQRSNSLNHRAPRIRVGE